MNRLSAALQRLYFLPGQVAGDPLSGGTLDLVGPDGRVRAMVVNLRGAAGWGPVAELYQGVEEDLALPAPALAVSEAEGYQLWFSLAEPVPAAWAGAFLEGLRRRYLAELPPAGVGLRPLGSEQAVLRVPALNPATGKWSAFVDPGLGGMFADEPWLEMAPGVDRQADLLAGFESIKAADFERVMALLAPAGGAEPVREAAAAPAAVVGAFGDPKSFLLAVMNDPAVSLEQRMEAARALLPYWVAAN